MFFVNIKVKYPQIYKFSFTNFFYNLIGPSSQTKLWLEFCLTAWANQGPSSKILSLQKFCMTSLFLIV